jgi:hypothetical protein
MVTMMKIHNDDGYKGIVIRTMWLLSVFCCGGSQFKPQKICLSFWIQSNKIMKTKAKDVHNDADSPHDDNNVSTFGAFGLMCRRLLAECAQQFCLQTLTLPKYCALFM